MTSDIAIRVQNLSKCYQIYDNPGDRLKQFIVPRIRRLFGLPHKPYYRDFWALQDISFEVKRGETVGIIGRNGSGKSTLLQIICGTLTPTAGEVQVNGRVGAILELGSGFNPEFTGRENVFISAAIYGLTQQEIEARFDAIAEFADIGAFLEQSVKTYSSGMYVRLAFAVLAHIDADILVIDEALAVGDAFFVQKCMRFLRQFMQKGTVLFVSHDTSSIKSLCSRAIWLDKGLVKAAGSSKNVAEAYLEALYDASHSEGAIELSVKANQDDPPQAINDAVAAPVTQLSDAAQTFDKSFGIGGATIVSVALRNENAQKIIVVNGGEKVTVDICVQAATSISRPIIGFAVKDRLGQDLFGENTYAQYQNSDKVCAAGSTLRAQFTFVMPYLQSGEYSISAAIANGTQAIHEQLHWVHDALVFKSDCRGYSTGLVGIPMSAIEFQVQ